MTDEQWELLWQHYLLDNPQILEEAKRQQDKEEFERENPNEEYVERDKHGYDKDALLPQEDHEEFKDPDFDAEWDAEDEESNSDIIDENPPENDFETLEGKDYNDSKVDTNFDDPDEWKEV